MEEILKLSHVVKFYPPHCRAVNDVSLSLKEKENICIYGEDGAGKTTLMKLIAGLIKSDSGEITLFQYPLHDMNDDAISLLRAEKVSLISKDLGLIHELTVYENIVLPYSIRRVSKIEYEEAANDIIRLLKLSQISDSLPAQISPYQQFLVCLARAIITKPEILLIDSFDYALSPEESMKAWEYISVIRNFSKTAMIFFSSFSINKDFIDKNYYMKNGVIKEV